MAFGGSVSAFLGLGGRAGAGFVLDVDLDGISIETYRKEAVGMGDASANAMVDLSVSVNDKFYGDAVVLGGGDEVGLAVGGSVSLPMEEIEQAWEQAEQFVHYAREVSGPNKGDVGSCPAPPNVSMTGPADLVYTVSVGAGASGTAVSADITYEHVEKTGTLFSYKWW